MFKGANCSFSGGVVHRKGLIFLRRENGNVKSPLLAMISPNSPDRLFFSVKDHWSGDSM